jgi:hypothetical protein
VSGAENIQMFVEGSFHVWLRGPWGVAKAKGHDQILILTRVRVEGSLPFIPLLYTGVVESSNNVELAEVLDSRQLIKDLAY